MDRRRRYILLYFTVFQWFHDGQQVQACMRLYQKPTLIGILFSWQVSSPDKSAKKGTPGDKVRILGLAFNAVYLVIL